MPRNQNFRLFFIPVLALTLVLAGCDGNGDEEPDETALLPLESPTAAGGLGDASPTSTVTTEAETATGTASPTETGVVSPPQPVERDGVAFLVPEGWSGSADNWTASDGEATLFFATAEWEPPMEPEALMLPDGVVNLDREEIDTPLGPGALHTIELTDVPHGPVYERHAIVRTDERFYDWSLRAESVEALDEHQQALDFILESLEPLEDEGDGDPLNPVG